jgi:hypothetical protein
MQALLQQVTVAQGAGPEDEYVEFWRAGQPGKGEFLCAGCGNGVIVYRELPQCPTCSEGVWERDPWSPFTRMADSTAVH